jgi:P-type E1-E2 ATPase
MAKEDLEDGERHRADHTTNRQATHCFRWSNAQPSHPILQNVLWNEVVVGDIVKIFNNGNIPADTILLGSLESFGNSYLETSNIDGETNLKLKCSVAGLVGHPRFTLDYAGGRITTFLRGR